MTNCLPEAGILPILEGEQIVKTLTDKGINCFIIPYLTIATAPTAMASLEGNVTCESVTLQGNIIEYYHAVKCVYRSDVRG